MISPKAKARILQLKDRYPVPRSALLPALHIAQQEAGYLSPEVMQEVGVLMDVPSVEVASVASFYTMFLRKPVGRHLIQVCTNISCSLMGAGHIVQFLQHELGIEVGQTSPDGRFTLLTVECLGSCGTAPMMQVNDDYYENLTEDRVREILNGLA